MAEKNKNSLSPIVTDAAGGETIRLKDDQFVYKLTSAQSGGAIAVIERTVAPKFQSPPQEHANMREDWLIYVLDGRIGVRLDGKESTLEKGALAFVPRGTYFRWWNPDNTSAQILTIYMPGAFSEFFKEVVSQISTQSERIGDYERTLAAILAIQDKFGMLRKKA